MNKLTMRGSSGELLKGYQRAAYLSAWTMPMPGRIEADAYEVDDFWLDDGPLVLRLDVGTRTLIWKNASVVQRQPRLVVVMDGSPETR